jgi:hypothetical protein
MILRHETSYCPRCKTATIGPSCHWCNGTQTVRFSPAEESRRCASYRRFRAAGVSHADAIALLDQVAELVACNRRTNTDAVRELVTAGREPAVAVERIRPLRSRMPVAVAA